MQKKKGLKIVILLLCALFCFVGGGALSYFTQNSEETEMTAQLHVYDGDIEYFDGSAWVKLSSFEKARNEDPFVLAFASHDGQNDADDPAPIRAGGVVPVQRRPSSSSGSSQPAAGGGGGTSTGGGGGGAPAPTTGDGEDITVGD